MTQAAEGVLTVMFTDIEASTDMATSRGDSAAQKAIAANRELVRRQLARYGGHEVETTGDGVLVTFSSTRASIACAVAIQQAQEAHNRRHPDQQLSIRIGLNTGEVVHSDEQIFGAAVHAAARIAAKATGGQVLVSELTRQLAGTIPEIDFGEHGRVRLKGFPEQWRLYEVVWHEPDHQSGALPSDEATMLGRERELAELTAGIDDALEGRSRLFLLTGEAGMGKTRLAEEVADLARQRGMLVLWGRCWEAVEAPAYWPWIQILRELEQSLLPEQMHAMAGPGAPALAALVPGIALDGTPPAAEPAGTQDRFLLFDAVAGLLKGAASAQPLVVVLEDLHAADEPSLLMLQLLANDHRSSALLVIGTYEEAQCRAKPSHQRSLSEIGREGRRITLRGLDEGSVTQLYESLAGEPPSAAIAAAVYRATEGNPLFVDETVRMLAAKGEIHRPDFSTGFRVPEGAKDIIRQRLASLPADVAELLSIASVIGREFDLTLLEKVSEVAIEPLLDLLGKAAIAEVVAETSALGRYEFTHILIRETLYEELTPGKRMRLHRRVAETLEEAYASEPDARLPELAHHWFKAAQAGDTIKTLHYVVQAAAAAMTQQAYEEAVRLYHRALKAAESGGADKSEIATIEQDLQHAVAASTEPVATPAALTGGTFAREGDYWSIEYAGQTVRLKDLKGLRYIARLLDNPGRELHVLDLVMAIEGVPARTATPGNGREGFSAAGLGDAGDVLDARAKAQYKQRLKDLQGELEEAQAFNDPERAARIKEEVDALTHELAAAVGLGGRDRKAASQAERARVNVTKLIKEAMKRIAENHEPLSAHLQTALRTGAYCSYSPDPRLPITWKVS